MFSDIILTADQQEAETAIFKFLGSEKPIFLLQGYAGTGKTTLLQSVLSDLREEIALLAPTNKAVKVLRDKVEWRHNITFATIDRFFSSRREFHVDGSVEYVPQGLSNPDVKIIFIDECSMIDSKKFAHIIRFIKMFGLQVILIGDDCQINPVNETISPSFRFKRFFESARLSEIKRQSDDSHIIPMSKAIRDHINKPFHFKGISKDDVEFLKSSNPADNVKMINEFFLSREYIDNPDYCKILGWTNSLVDRSNTAIRKHIFGPDARYLEEEETLVANKPVFYLPSDVEKPFMIPTNDNFKVLHFKLTDKTVSTEAVLTNFPSYILEKLPAMPEFSVNLQVYDTWIQYGRHEGLAQVLHPDSKEDYKRIVSFSKTLAKKLIDSKQANADDIKTAWKVHYKYKDQFADFKYNHAITVHKSQGSTYDNVFVYGFDILRNRRVTERNRILYTAVTRAAKKLFVIL